MKNTNTKLPTKTKIPFFDRSRADTALFTQLGEAFQRVISSGHYILGPEVQKLEKTLAHYLGIQNALALSSCSDALLCSMLALGVQPGDEIICPAYTFFATAGSIARLNARPIFVDIEARSYNIDPQKLKDCISPNTKGIIPVHLFGCPANLKEIQEIAQAKNLWIIEDAAQALGTKVVGTLEEKVVGTQEEKVVGTLKEKMAGTLAQAGCYSFFPTKNLGGFGDGGLFVSDDDELAARVHKLRVHGSSRKHHHEIIGGNYRMDALQAALLSQKFLHLEEQLLRRKAIARQYDRYFLDRGLASAEDTGDNPIQLGARPPGHSFNQYVIRISKGKRDFVRAYLEERGVGTEIYYPKPLHMQPAFKALGYKESQFPEAERASLESLALPIFPELLDEEVLYVAEQTAKAFD